jgi:hypothetical protein
LSFSFPFLSFPFLHFILGRTLKHWLVYK